MMRQIKLFLLITIINLAFSMRAREHYFSHYDITNGLSQNTVHKILQDRQGFMWFATKDGLNRFDGTNFRRIEIDGDEGSASFIFTLYEDSTGKIWVGSHKGPCVYDPLNEKLEWLESNTKKGEAIYSSINDFTELPDGRILIAVENNGIFSYNPNDSELRRVFGGGENSLNSVTKLCYCPSGRLYVGTFGSGVFFTDDEFRSIEPVTNESGLPYFNNAAVNAMQLHKGRIYVATDNMGLHSIDENAIASPVFVVDEKGEVPIMRDINFNNCSEVAVGTENGLYIYNISERALKSHLRHDYFDRYSLSDDAIYSVITDRDGGLWIGSYFGGVDYQAVKKPSFIKFSRNGSEGSLASERIRELCTDNSGNVYVGSEDHGISVFNPRTGKFRPLEGISEKNIHGLCLDGNELWVGTFSDGLIIKELNSGLVRKIKVGDSYNLMSDYIFSVLRTHQGDIYVGSFSGLQHYDRKNHQFSEISPLHGLFVYDTFEDSKGNIWVATYSNGIFLKKANEQRWINFIEDRNSDLGLPSNKTYSVQEDSAGNIWIMTQNGACVYSHEKDCFNATFHHIDKIDGVAYRMEEDEGGRYWLASNHGIYCIDPHKDKMWSFNTQDGLPTDQFNYNSSLKTADGKIYFGSIDGLVCFDPMKFMPESVPQVAPVVTELYVHSVLMLPGMEDSPLEKSISMTKEVILEPWQNSVTFNLSTFIYNHPAGQKIKYRLFGFQDDWQYTDIDYGVISYPNLPSGKYHLQAAICNEHDGESGPVYDLAVIVNVPVYKQWWAILGYIILGFVILWFVYFYYRRYTNISNQRYIEHYKHEKERELFDSKIKFFTNVAHEIRTPLTLIKAPLDSAFHNKALNEFPEIRENLDVININVDRLLHLADQLLDFRKIESGNYHVSKRNCDICRLINDIVMNFKPTVENTGMKIDVALPADKMLAYTDVDALTKIITNLLSNAIKYGSSHIRISLDEEAGYFSIRVSNDGEVIATSQREKIFNLFTRLDSEKPGTGIGLAYARSLASALGGSLVMNENMDENVFVLKLPIGNVTEDVVEEDETYTDLDEAVDASGVSFNTLIVEDNQELLAFLQKKLIERNYKVFTAVDGVDALTILKDQYIDIIVTDIMMPRMDGYELLKYVKEDVKYSHIPVILLTAKTLMEDKLSGLGAGADLFIEKPFSIEYLLVSMDSLLRNRDRIRMRMESVPLEKLPEKELSKADEEFLVNINNIIRENFRNPDFSVENIVEKLGLSSSTFYRKVKGLLNLNPNEYIKLQRLKHAATLFKEGKTSISEVCYLVGFSSPGYFTKCFIRQFGISPKEYISNNRKKK